MRIIAEDEIYSSSSEELKAEIAKRRAEYEQVKLILVKEYGARLGVTILERPCLYSMGSRKILLVCLSDYPPMDELLSFIRGYNVGKREAHEQTLP